jgi:hypothetical protein
MASRAQKLATVDDVEPRRRVRESIRSAVKTAPGGADRHVHCAIFLGDDGRGCTSPAPDGHFHVIRDLEIVPAEGHTHDLSSVRCLERHTRTARHVEGR